MLTLTLEQARAANAAGGIDSVTIKAQGNNFFVRFVTRNGEAILTKARSTEPRGFGNPMQAIQVLMGLGIMMGAFDVSQWSSEPDEHSRVRPDRRAALRDVHEAAEYDRWFREQVEEGIREADDPNTEWVDHDVVLQEMARQKKELQDRIKKSQ